MFATRNKESPASRRRRGKEELRKKAARLLGIIEDHLAHAHPPPRRRRARDGRVHVTIEHDNEKGKERMVEANRESSAPAVAQDTRSGSSDMLSSSAGSTSRVCHVEDMVKCVEQLNLLWDWVVVFGGKEQIQEVFLALPMIETIMRLLKRHTEAAPLFTRCAQFLGPLVTENMTAKMRLERAKGVRVFGLAYQEFGPWALCDQPATSNQKIDDVAKKAIASGFAQMGIASAARAMGKQDRLIAGMEATDAAEVREIRHLLEKHAAFEAIREFFFCLTKSIAVLSSRHPQEENYLQRLKQKVNKMLYRPQLIERRVLFMSRHILGYSILWSGLKAEYDHMRKEYSNLQHVSLPTAHIDPPPLQPQASRERLGKDADASTPTDPVTSIPLSISIPATPDTTSAVPQFPTLLLMLASSSPSICQKTKAMMCAEVREQKLEQILCRIHLMEVRVDQLAPDVDQDGLVVRNRNPFVVIQQWRWKEAPRRQQPALWKSTIVRHTQSAMWDLRPLGEKESGSVLLPKVGRFHKLHRTISGFVYRSNPVAQGVTKLELWWKRRKALKKRKKSPTVTTVGAAEDDRIIALTLQKTHKKTKRDLGDDHQSGERHHHHNPKHIPKRVKKHVKSRRYPEEPRDPAITTLVREMHNCFRARFFPPLKVAVYDWISPDEQAFLGRVEIDPAVVFLLEKEAHEARKIAEACMTTKMAQANAQDVRQENASLNNRGRRGSFLWEMIDSDKSETEYDDEEQRTDEEAGADPLREVKEYERFEAHAVSHSAKHERDKNHGENKLDDELEEIEDVEKRDEASRLENEQERTRERDDIRRESRSNNPDIVDTRSASSSQAVKAEKEVAPSQSWTAARSPSHAQLKNAQPSSVGESKNGMETIAAGSDQLLDKRQRKTAAGIARKQRRKEEQERKRTEQEQKKEQNRQNEEAKKAMRRMSKSAAASPPNPSADTEYGITVVLPLYAGEEERHTPGVERHHDGIMGCVSLTLSVSPPHWSAAPPDTDRPST